MKSFISFISVQNISYRLLFFPGEVYACGSDYYGTIGCDNSLGENVLTPTKIKSLSGIFIETISCGDSHVVAVTSEGINYFFQRIMKNRVYIVYT